MQTLTTSTASLPKKGIPMCILIHHTADTNFELGHLQDFYSKNPDGFGAMVKKPDGVKIIKTVGNLDEIHELYNNEIKGHEAVIHFRMKTHGDIDLFNCHPYQVTENLWMAHNGILSTGNHADLTKSDTWHYIQNFLRPLLMRDQSLIHEPAFQKLIESHISSSNKFGFMDNDGKVVVINRSAGVNHFGAWLSNTYAWSPMKWGYYSATYGSGYSNGHGSYYGGSLLNGNRYGYASEDPIWDQKSKTWVDPAPKSKPLTRKEKKAQRKKSQRFDAIDRGIKPVKQLSTDSLGRIIRSCYNAMSRNPTAGLTDWVIMNPMKAMYMIREFYPEMYEPSEISDIVNSDPDEAAAILEAAWYECEEDMMAIAGIPFTYEQGALI
jgi:hypothetical protein